MKLIYSVTFLLFFSGALSSCTNQVKKTSRKDFKYQDQIGDTPFDPKLDNPNFKICDSVLHKRALVLYEGGKRAFKKEFLKKYNTNPSYESFTGYFIVRFLVNCHDETDRFRIQTLDSHSSLTKSPAGLEEQILTIAKNMKGWHHPIYEGRDHDGYRFFIIKMIKGKIQ